MVCSLKDREKMVIPPADELGNVEVAGNRMTRQQALDRAYTRLQEFYPDQAYIWDLSKAQRWGNAPASDAQMQLIRRKCREKYEVPGNLTKLQASQVLNRLMNGGAA